MHILLTNDDGVGAPGLEALRAAFQDRWETSVVAPASHCSGVGHALGLYRDIIVEKLSERVWSVSGTPADCVKLALAEILPRRPGLVVSGINSGPNLGNNIHYSGTVAAATEAAFWGIPAIAASSISTSPENYEGMASYVSRLVESGIAGLIPPGTVLNLNLPPVSLEELGEPVWTRTARFSEDAPFRVLEPGRHYGYGRIADLPVVRTEGTDVEAARSGKVTATLLGVDRSLPGITLPGGAG
jgi:5'-nucleotidase